MKPTFRIILTAFLATAAVMEVAPALAASTSVNVSVVRTADLDLFQPTPRRHQLDQRLVVAAREVCGTASDADLAGKNHVRDCRDKVLDQVRERRNTLVASARSGERIAVTAAR